MENVTPEPQPDALTPALAARVLAVIEQTRQLPQEAFAALGLEEQTARGIIMRGDAESDDPASLYGQLYRDLCEQQARLSIRI